jgi:D-xylose reductase
MNMEETIKVGTTKMPSVGLGLWKIERDEVAEVVRQAIEVGYRHLDSAADYGNEIEVGHGIKKALEDGLCKREELWITSKLWNTFHAAEHVEQACDKTLQDLGVDYLDLYLIHFPISLQYVPIATRYPPEWIVDPQAQEPEMRIAPVPLSETWRAMEALVAKGKVKRIGVCNYNSALLHDLMAYAKIKPAILQIESHPYLTQERLLRVAADYDIAVTTFSPLGSLSYVALDMAREEESLLQQPAVLAAAARVKRSAAQVLLRWGVQRGTAIIPKTSRVERLRENIDLFDFSLTPQEMSAIAALNCNRRFNDPGLFCELAFGKFYPIYD